MLDQFFSAVTEFDELSSKAIGVDVDPGPNDDWFDRGRSRAELLQQRAHASDDDLGRAIFVAEAPEDLEALSHGLDARADAFERERLPAGEQRNVVLGDKLHEVVGKLGGHCAGRASNDEGSAVRQVGERRNSDGSSDFDDGEARIGFAECSGEAGFAPQQAGQ